MKREEDDFSAWRQRQKNQAAPFFYVYPQMPPRFRWCRRFAQALFVVEWGACWMFFLGSIPILFLVAVVPLLQGKEAGTLPVNYLLLLLPLRFLARWLRHTTKFFWHCPCCGQPFPYYAPDGRHEEMREKECYHTLWQLRIGYVKTRLCPLVIPSECPACKRKFFRIEDGNFGNR